MSKMSELFTTLDELVQVAKNLIECGEALIRIVKHVKEIFSEDEPTAVAAPDPEPVAVEAPPRQYTKEEVRAVLAGISQAGFRNEAKALVKKYGNGGSLTDIDPEDYPALIEEAEQYHA